jgi:hypothetical protein
MECGVPSERISVLTGDSQGYLPGLVCDAPSGHGIENVVAGLAPTEPRRHVRTRCSFGRGRGIEMPLFKLPQRGNVYQAGHRPGNCKLP